MFPPVLARWEIKDDKGQRVHGVEGNSRKFVFQFPLEFCQSISHYTYINALGNLVVVYVIYIYFYINTSFRSMLLLIFIHSYLDLAQVPVKSIRRVLLILL